MPLDKTMQVTFEKPNKTKVKVTAPYLENALRAKYSGDQWRIWFEVSQSTGFAASLLRTSNSIADKKIEERAEEIVSQKIDAALKQQEFSTSQKLKQFAVLENWKKRLEAKIGEPIHTWTPPEYLAEKLLIVEKLQLDSLTRTQSAAKEIVRLIDELIEPTNKQTR